MGKSKADQRRKKLTGRKKKQDKDDGGIYSETQFKTWRKEMSGNWRRGGKLNPELQNRSQEQVSGRSKRLLMGVSGLPPQEPDRKIPSKKG